MLGAVFGLVLMPLGILLLAALLALKKREKS